MRKTALSLARFTMRDMLSLPREHTVHEVFNGRGLDKGRARFMAQDSWAPVCPVLRAVADGFQDHAYSLARELAHAVRRPDEWDAFLSRQWWSTTYKNGERETP